MFLEIVPMLNKWNLIGFQNAKRKKNHTKCRENILTAEVPCLGSFSPFPRADCQPPLYLTVCGVWDCTNHINDFFCITVIFPFLLHGISGSALFLKGRKPQLCPLRKRVIKGCMSIIMCGRKVYKSLEFTPLRSNDYYSYPSHFLALYLDQTCKCEECLQITLEVLMKLLH